ncbi:MAG: ABC-F family ATP-binding cassette domain-containing protein [Alphaproteobacteria bacterium]|nr:ABC-F family ATP-binding cassette domain-containing protein [Alphaproteobacteria bacterium]
MPVSLRALSYTTPDDTRLFDALDLSFGAERTGLVGRNGAGKSTLLRLIAGELQPASGEILRAGEVRLLRQAVAVPGEMTVADAFGAREALARLARLEAGEGSLDDAGEADWALPARLDDALAAVGLEGMEQERRVTTLSGGQRTRLDLAALTFDAPDTILLDEPTNNLDREGRYAVAELLRGWRGTAIVASHDRELLRHMDRIVEISGLGVRIYGGGFDLYAERKAEERALAAQSLATAERNLRSVDRQIQSAREKKQKRDAAGAQRAARGGAPRILLGAMKRRAEVSAGKGSDLAERQRGEAAEALEAARARVERIRQLHVDLPGAAVANGRKVLAFDRVTAGYDTAAPVVRDLSFEIVGPERVALTGPNGSGKTTVLRLVTGALQPMAGDVRRGVPVAMLDQHVEILDASETILANFRRLNPGDTDNACRAALARFLFRNEAALRVVATLSGGERLRAGLACVLGGTKPPGLLILDEPTNHLDLDSIAAIESGLAAYDGALLVVSHDDDFLDAIGVERRIALR